jgi:hypothetical protein
MAFRKGRPPSARHPSAIGPDDRDVEDGVSRIDIAGVASLGKGLNPARAGRRTTCQVLASPYRERMIFGQQQAVQKN